MGNLGGLLQSLLSVTLRCGREGYSESVMAEPVTARVFGAGIHISIAHTPYLNRGSVIAHR
jgi:hypothetical protein